jgi:hypothetical protein
MERKISLFVEVSRDFSRFVLATISMKKCGPKRLYFLGQPLHLHHPHGSGHPEGAGRCRKIDNDLSAYCGPAHRFGSGEKK